MVDLPQDERSKARRLARAIATDISMYNEEKIVRGLEQDNFFEALKDEIEEGRELFRSRVSAEIYQKSNLFDRAIVDIIIKPKGHVRSRIW
jgi:predicted NBD/HSP70 family sugar kinase